MPKLAEAAFCPRPLSVHPPAALLPPKRGEAPKVVVPTPPKVEEALAKDQHIVEMLENVLPKPPPVVASKAYTPDPKRGGWSNKADGLCWAIRKAPASARHFALQWPADSDDLEGGPDM